MWKIIRKKTLSCQFLFLEISHYQSPYLQGDCFSQALEGVWTYDWLVLEPLRFTRCYKLENTHLVFSDNNYNK